MHYVLRLQRATVVVAALPNVPFAALTLRWAIDELGFQPVFGALTERTQMYPNNFRFQFGCVWLEIIISRVSENRSR